MKRNADILKTVMERRGLSDADVASLTGKNATTIYRQREGRVLLADRKLAEMLVALDEDPGEFDLPVPISAVEVQPAWAKRIEDKLDKIYAALEAMA